MQGADYTNAARAMMFAVGCLQAQRCHTNTCPVGVATQDPRRVRALDVADKSAAGAPLPAGHRAQREQIMAAMGVRSRPSSRRTGCCGAPGRRACATYAELYEWLAPGVLLAEPPPHWAADWAAADPDTF